MYELSIKTNIAAAHFLRGYEGKCKDLHGHTWKIQVFIQTQDLNEIGMVIDFIDLKKKLNAFLEHIDHKCLNDIEYFKEFNPTTENIAKYIYDNFANDIKPLKISRVRVFESENASVEYYE